jgi:hypothetical protein
MTNQGLQIKERVKHGELATVDALKLVDKSCATYRWLQRRLHPTMATAAPVSRREKKYRSKKVGS